MKIEVFKKIKGHEDYHISSFGRILSYKRKKTSAIIEMRPNQTPNGYLKVSLWSARNATTGYIHKLVLEAFKGAKPFKNAQCCHNDGNSLNNHVNNLRWDTPKANQNDRIKHGTDNSGERGGRAKFKNSDILKIRELYKSGKSYKQIREIFNTTSSHIYLIVTRRSWKHV